MITTNEEIEELTEKIIGCAIEVHRILEPGLLESVYRECMMIEMRREGLRFESEQHIALDYKGQRIRGALKLDLLVEGCVVVDNAQSRLETAGSPGSVREEELRTSCFLKRILLTS